MQDQEGRDDDDAEDVAGPQAQVTRDEIDFADVQEPHHGGVQSGGDRADREQPHGVLQAGEPQVQDQIRRDPSYTFGSVMTYACAAWTQSLMKRGPDVLAVQTFRNSTMVSTLLASTSVLLIMGVLNMSGQADKLSATWHLWNNDGSVAPKLFMFKLILLPVDLFVAFFSFAISLRFFNHVGYMINVPAELRRDVFGPECVAQQLNRAGRAYQVGMRSYYFLVPLVLWLFSPDLMLLASLVLVFVRYQVDLMPRADAHLMPRVSESRPPIAIDPREAAAVGLKAAA